MMKTISEEELREAIAHCEEGNPQEQGKIVLQAAQAYLKQRPCIEAIKAARREATEGEWFKCEDVEGYAGPSYTIVDIDGKFICEIWDEENHSDNDFITTAANEASRLIKMEDDDEEL
jgi:hypothetical protein